MPAYKIPVIGPKNDVPGALGVRRSLGVMDPLNQAAENLRNTATEGAAKVLMSIQEKDDLVALQKAKEDFLRNDLAWRRDAEQNHYDKDGKRRNLYDEYESASAEWLSQSSKGLDPSVQRRIEAMGLQEQGRNWAAAKEAAIVQKEVEGAYNSELNASVVMALEEKRTGKADIDELIKPGGQLDTLYRAANAGAPMDDAAKRKVVDGIGAMLLSTGDIRTAAELESFYKDNKERMGAEVVASFQKTIASKTEDEKVETFMSPRVAKGIWRPDNKWLPDTLEAIRMDETLTAKEKEKARQQARQHDHDMMSATKDSWDNRKNNDAALIMAAPTATEARDILKRFNTDALNSESSNYLTPYAVNLEAVYNARPDVVATREAREKAANVQAAAANAVLSPTQNKMITSAFSAVRSLDFDLYRTSAAMAEAGIPKEYIERLREVHAGRNALIPYNVVEGAYKDLTKSKNLDPEKGLAIMTLASSYIDTAALSEGGGQLPASAVVPAVTRAIRELNATGVNREGFTRGGNLLKGGALMEGDVIDDKRYKDTITALSRQDIKIRGVGYRFTPTQVSRALLIFKAYYPDAEPTEANMRSFLSSVPSVGAVDALYTKMFGAGK